MFRSTNKIHHIAFLVQSSSIKRRDKQFLFLEYENDLKERSQQNNQWYSSHSDMGIEIIVHILALRLMHILRPIPQSISVIQLTAGKYPFHIGRIIYIRIWRALKRGKNQESIYWHAQPYDCSEHSTKP